MPWMQPTRKELSTATSSRPIFSSPSESTPRFSISAWPNSPRTSLQPRSSPHRKPPSKQVRSTSPVRAQRSAQLLICRQSRLSASNWIPALISFLSALSSTKWLRAGSPFAAKPPPQRSEEHTSELQSQSNLVCRLLLEKKKKKNNSPTPDLKNQQHSNISL